MKSVLSSLIHFRISVCFTLLLTLISGEIYSHHYQTSTYTEANGLANSMIYSIVQDTAGIIWIGRRAGISSYDGRNFYNYNVTDGLKTASYAFLRVDEKHCLWALPESGTLFLLRFDGTKWQTGSSSKGLLPDFHASYTSFDVIYKQDKPLALIGTSEKGLFVYKDSHWRNYSSAQGLQGKRINSARGFEGKIYVATEKGLFLLDNDIVKPYQDSGSSQLAGNILAMERQGKLLWLLGEDWLGFLSEGKFTMVAEGFKIPFLDIRWNRFLYPGQNGKIYFGDPHSVSFYDMAIKRIVTIDRNSGLISDGGTSVLIDRELNTWITGYRGITKISSERFASFTENEGLAQNEVASAMEIGQGRYVFGHEGVLTFFDGKTLTPFDLDPLDAAPDYKTRVLDMQKDSNNNLWIAASSLGVACIDRNRRVTWYHENQGLPGIAYSIAIVPSGQIYAATSTGLFRFDKGRFSIIDLKQSRQLGIRKILPGNNGQLYLSTLSSGLFLLNGTHVESYVSKENRLANSTYTILTDSHGRIWVGTGAGLYELADKELKQVNQNGLIISTPVFVILEDRQGSLWFGTDNGVLRWNKDHTLNHFTTSDGLSGLETNRAAGFIDSKSHIWFGTNNGITVFRPELDYKPGQVPPPKIRILSVISDADTLDPSGQNDFSYDQNDFVFNARVISLINEQQVYIRYFLEGFDTGWSNEVQYSTNQFSFNNLEPGTYRFHIKARNSLGIWSEEIMSAPFTVLPPFWLRWWFIGLVFIFFSGLILMTGRFILVHRFNSRLQQEVDLRTMELQKSEKALMESNAAKDSFFSIIAHDLRNPFNVILGYLDLLTCDDADYSEKEQRKILLKLKSASVRTIDLLENLLTWAQAQRGSLPFNPEKFNLSEVIADNINLHDTFAHSKDISLIPRIERDIKVFADRNMISTVIRNLISNALKFTFPGGTVIIGVEIHENENVVVYVKDNGMGISPAVLDNLFKIEQRTVCKGTANETGTGLGLILCKEFIEKNGGKIQVTNNSDTGSTFSFTLPVA